LGIAASVDELAAKIGKAVGNEIKKRFIEVSEKKQHGEDSVEAGREFVEAYVQYVHFIEGIHNMVTKGAPDRKASELTSGVNSRE
jgi:hypothetical protein